MNTQFFSEKILAPLAAWSALGEATNEMGTRLIGHAPHIAPKAYVHVMYAPLSDQQLEEFRVQVGRAIPRQLLQFLGFANGLSLFLGNQFRVFGYVPLERRASSSVYHYPSSILMANGVARPTGLYPADVIVGWYEEDSSRVCIQESGLVVRFDAQGSGEALQEWPDFDTWLSSEIAVRNRAYRKTWARQTGVIPPAF